MRKISVYICLVLLALLVTSCSEFVTPVAYTRFDSSTGQYVYYSSKVGGPQLFIYRDDDEPKTQFPVTDIEFSFTRCCGADDLEGERYILVDLTKNITYTTVLIDKERIYSPSKSIYLNGKAYEPDQIDVGDYSVILTFEELPFVRTNPHGRINPEAVNVIEYK